MQIPARGSRLAGSIDLEEVRITLESVPNHFLTVRDIWRNHKEKGEEKMRKSIF